MAATRVHPMLLVRTLLVAIRANVLIKGSKEMGTNAQVWGMNSLSEIVYQKSCIFATARDHEQIFLFSTSELSK